MNEDRRKKLKFALGLLAQARDVVENIRDEEQGSFDNMPEGMQGGEKGQRMEEIIQQLDEAFGHIEEAEGMVDEATA